jgi:glycosyl transferase family 25
MNDRSFLDIFLVSLPKDDIRRKNLGIKPDYTYAVDGSTLDIDKLKKDGIISNNNTLTKGEIGCYLSHVHLLKKALNSKKPVLILEDDAKIEVDTLNKIKKVIENPPKDWDLIFLGYNYYEEYSTFKQINYLHGTHAYLINTKNLTKAKIDSLLPIEKPYDVILPIKFKTYISQPKIIQLGEFGGISNTQSIR